MSQYFKLVNVDRHEYAELPGSLRAISRVTNAVAGGMISYLLLDGPCDGTKFSSNVSPDHPLVAAKMDDKKQAERASERDLYRTYVTQERDYIVRKLEREWDATPEEMPVEFRKLCDENAQSVYRNDDGSWNEQKLAKVIAAGIEIDDLTEYAGRWAGDEVRLVGDYDDSELYNESKGTVTARNQSGQFVSWTGRHPNVAEKLPSKGPGIRVQQYDRNAERGDSVKLRNCKDDFGSFVSYTESEWTNITDGLRNEFEDFVGEAWLENPQDGQIMSPDMVLTSN